MLFLILSTSFPALAASDGGSGEAAPVAMTGMDASTSMEDFALDVRSNNLTVTTTATTILIWTEEYCICVDHATSFITYDVRPYFSSDFIRYGRVNPEVPGDGTVDQYGNALDSVAMTISEWGQDGDTIWFLESCAEFSIKQSFALYRDYFELDVTYTPGTKNVLTTYSFGLYTATNSLISLFDDGENYRYVPGNDEDTPAGYGLGGWYPSFKMFAPACDLRVPSGNLGVEWGYNETVAYIGAPVWLKDVGGGNSLFGLKYTSMDSVVPNVALGSAKTFHMFVRPYQYSDGETHGYDVGYAQWVAPKIASAWGNHDTSIFPLTIMDTGSWTDSFRSWVESSQVKLATYSSDPDQIDWNYKSAQIAGLTNAAPADVPTSWQLYSSSGVPMLTSDGNVVCNPVSGPYDEEGTYRWQLIMNDTYQDWWTSSQAVFWDEMNNWDAYDRLKSDYQNRADFIYTGYLELVRESYQSNFWNYVITNSFTGLLHLAIASDITLIEGYEPSSVYDEDMTKHVQSVMNFVNNIPVEYRPNILVYQNYATSSASDQKDVYSVLFGSAVYGYHVELLSYDSYASQMHNLVMAEEMFIAMGCTRDSDVRIPVATLDLTESSSLTTSASMVVTTGAGTASITLTEVPEVFTITDLWGTQNSFDLTMLTSNYFEAGANVGNSAPMTFYPDGSATFHGVIDAEKTGEVRMTQQLEVIQQQAGSVDVAMISCSADAVQLDVAASSGTTTIILHELEPQRSYDVVVNGQNEGNVISDENGTVSFSRSYGANDAVMVLISEVAVADPQVVSCAPGNGSVGIEIDAVIQIGFSEPMDRASTEAAFSLSCQSDTVQGVISWSDDDRLLTFTPGTSLLNLTEYRIKIGLQAEDLLGAHQTAAFASSFVTEDDRSAIISPQPEEPPASTEEPNDTSSVSSPQPNGGSVEFFYLTYLGYLPGQEDGLAFSQSVCAFFLFSMLCGVDLVLYRRGRREKR